MGFNGGHPLIMSRVRSFPLPRQDLHWTCRDRIMGYPLWTDKQNWKHYLRRLRNLPLYYRDIYANVVRDKPFFTLSLTPYDKQRKNCKIHINLLIKAHFILKWVLLVDVNAPRCCHFAVTGLEALHVHHFDITNDVRAAFQSFFWFISNPPNQPFGHSLILKWNDCRPCLVGMWLYTNWGKSPLIKGRRSTDSLVGCWKVTYFVDKLIYYYCITVFTNFGVCWK